MLIPGYVKDVAKILDGIVKEIIPKGLSYTIIFDPSISCQGRSFLSITSDSFLSFPGLNFKLELYLEYDWIQVYFFNEYDNLLVNEWESSYYWESQLDAMNSIEDLVKPLRVQIIKNLYRNTGGVPTSVLNCLKSVQKTFEEVFEKRLPKEMSYTSRVMRHFSDYNDDYIIRMMPKSMCFLPSYAFEITQEEDVYFQQETYTPEYSQEMIYGVVNLADFKESEFRSELDRYVDQNFFQREGI